MAQEKNSVVNSKQSHLDIIHALRLKVLQTGVISTKKFDKYVNESFEAHGLTHPKRWNARHLGSLMDKGVDAHHGDLPMVANAAPYGLADTLSAAMQSLESKLELRLLKHHIKGDMA